ncbi:hypothetical protein B0H12DRAFT_1081242 [Mycena haematopus]|nr:hypothetical protein B0H12DRAFT_1081242 [Mycena haematopus]
MTEANIYIPLWLAILVQRSTCFSWVVEPSDSESSLYQTSALPAKVPASSGTDFTIVAGTFNGGQGTVNDIGTITPNSSGNSFASVPTFVPGGAQTDNAGGGLGVVPSSAIDPVSSGGGDTGVPKLHLTGTQTFSAISVANTQTSASASITLTVSPGNPSTLPANPSTSIFSSSPGALPIVQLSSTSSTSSQLPVTSTFGNDIHKSATLSPSTSIFTTTSYSVFTTDGHITSTAIPILSSSVTMVSVPTSSSAQAASSE